MLFFQTSVPVFWDLVSVSREIFCAQKIKNSSLLALYLKFHRESCKTSCNDGVISDPWWLIRSLNLAPYVTEQPASQLPDSGGIKGQRCFYLLSQSCRVRFPDVWKWIFTYLSGEEHHKMWFLESYCGVQGLLHVCNTLFYAHTVCSKYGLNVLFVSIHQAAKGGSPRKMLGSERSVVEEWLSEFKVKAVLSSASPSWLMKVKCSPWGHLWRLFSKENHKLWA